MAGELIGALRVMLGLDTAQFEDGVKGATRHAKALEKTFDKWGSRMRKTGDIMSIGITAPLVLFSKQAIQTAMDAEELDAAFGETFGKNTVVMDKWARSTGDAMGRSTREMKEMLNTFGIFFNQAAPTSEVANELSQDFTKLAQDLASFFNTSNEQALQALRSGLSGESEPLRRYGVFLSEAAVKAKAAEMGIKAMNGKFTDQQKIMIRAAIIMEKTTKAQGDVLRTADSSANRLRASQAAWEELSITVGNELLPALTPLVTKFSELVNAFGKLNPETQKWIMYIAGGAAVLGPVLSITGRLTSAIGTLIPMLVSTGPAGAAAGGGMTAAAGGFRAFAAAALPIVGVIAGIAAAGYLIYKNWDTIAPVMKKVGDSIQKAIGPTVMKAVESFKEAMTRLWEGPFGDALRYVGSELAQFATEFVDFFGPVLMGAVRGVITFLSGAFNTIVDLLNIVGSVLKGDFSGAWTQTGELLINTVKRLWDVVESIFPGITESIKKLYREAKQWLGDALGNVLDSVSEKVKKAGDFFYDLYDRVVGNSYVPDMVDEIGEHMARLEETLVEKARDKTTKAADLFRQMQEDVSAMLERLYPEAALFNRWQADVKLLEQAHAKGILTANQYADAIQRLRHEFWEAEDNMIASNDNDKWKLPDDFSQSLVKPNEDAMKEVRRVLDKEMEGINDSLRDKTADTVMAFVDMSNNILGSVRGLANSLKSGDILGSIMGFLDVIGQVAGLFGGKSASPAVKTKPMPGYRYGTDFTVGGSGNPDSKLVQFMASPGERVRVTPRGKAANDGLVVYVRKGEMFDAHVERVAGPLADRAAERGAVGGAALATQQRYRSEKARMS